LWEDVIQLQLNDDIDDIVHDNVRRRSLLSHIAGNIGWELFERGQNER